MNTSPTEHHQWLQTLIGRWHFQSQCNTDPGQAPVTFSGIETVKPVGPLWIVAEGEGSMPDGSTALTRLSLGFDPEADCYTGNFICSMMTFQWIYRGHRSSDGRILTLDTEGPVCGPSGFSSERARYQDIIEIVSDDERIFRSQMLDNKGVWQPVMHSRYTRNR